VALVVRALYRPNEFNEEDLAKMTEIVKATPLVEYLVNQAKIEVSANIKELIDERDARINELAGELHEARNGSTIPSPSQGLPSSGAGPQPSPVSPAPAMDMAAIQAMVQDTVRQMMVQPPQNIAPVATASGYRPMSNRTNPILPWLNNR
jgi:hypothetical protein